MRSDGATTPLAKFPPRVQATREEPGDINGAAKQFGSGRAGLAYEPIGRRS
jgi:hypothetical protein